MRYSAIDICLRSSGISYVGFTITWRGIIVTVVKRVWHDVDDKMVPLMSVCKVCDRTIRSACLRAVVVRDLFILPSYLKNRDKPRNKTACVIAAVYNNTTIPLHYSRHIIQR